MQYQSTITSHQSLVTSPYLPLSFVKSSVIDETPASDRFSMTESASVAAR